MRSGNCEPHFKRTRLAWMESRRLLKAPTDAQRSLGRVQVVIRVADESIEVAIASQCIYIKIVAHIVLDTDTRVGCEAVAIGMFHTASRSTVVSPSLFSP